MPENYKGQPGIDFLKITPTILGDTRVLHGYPDEYSCVTRKSGSRWFSVINFYNCHVITFTLRNTQNFKVFCLKTRQINIPMRLTVK